MNTNKAVQGCSNKCYTTTSTLHCSYLQIYGAGVYAALSFMTWNRGILKVCCIGGILAL